MKSSFLSLLAAFILAWQQPPATPGASAQDTARYETQSPTVAQESIVTHPDSILVQLDWEPTFWDPSPSQYQPFGRVPALTLFGDGRVIFLSRERRERGSILSVLLTPAKADSIRRSILALGFSKLESHTSHFMQLPDGHGVSVSDAAYSIIRVRLPSGELRVVKNYADFANVPVILWNIRRHLNNWTSPDATPYVPDRGTLVIVSCDRGSQGLGEVPEWPLDPTLLTSAPRQVHEWGGRASIERARVINRHEYEALVQARKQQVGLMTFAHETAIYTIVLRPWLPGEDFTREVASYTGRWGK